MPLPDWMQALGGSEPEKKKPKKSSGSGKSSGGGRTHSLPPAPAPQTSGFTLPTWLSNPFSGSGSSSPAPAEPTEPSGAMLMDRPTFSPELQREVSIWTTEPEERERTAEEKKTAQRREEARVRDRAPQFSTGGRRKNKVSQLSWADYQALDPRERAAVDFNTMLVDAVRKDKRLGDKYAPGEQQQATYDERVSNMFAKPEQAPDYYAPETVAMLDSIDFDGRETGVTLDDFMGLKAAISDKDLNRIDSGYESNAQPNSAIYSDPARETTPRQTSTEFAATMADRTASLQKEMVKANELLGAWRSSARSARNESVELYGGRESKLKTALGYGRAQFDESGMPLNIDAYFQAGLTELSGIADDPAKTEQAMSSILSGLSSEADQKAFVAFVDNRLGSAGRLMGRGRKGSEQRTRDTMVADLRETLGLETADRYQPQRAETAEQLGQPLRSREKLKKRKRKKKDAGPDESVRGPGTQQNYNSRTLRY